MNWPQWGQSATHEGEICTVGQKPLKQLDDLIFDPLVPQEAAEGNGGLLVHYQSPLIIGDDLYMEVKSGTYVSCNPPGSGMPAPCGPQAWNSQIWNEAHYRVGENGKLTKQWSFESDWKPEPMWWNFEPIFHAVIADPFLYVPGAGGTLFKLDRKSGVQLDRINPFGTTIDPNTYVAGPPSADEWGNVYYNVLKLDATAPFGADAQGWLVKVAASGEIHMASYPSLVPSAPKPTDLCRGTYPVDWTNPGATLPLPPPLNPDGTLPAPPSHPCLSQRPSINVAPAVADDGTIYVTSRAHGSERYSYLVAVNPDLTPKWATSLRGLLNDGCGVLVPEDGDNMQHMFDCRPGAPMGVDPWTGEAPAATADDGSSSSPIVLPDGAVLYGSLTSYNGSRGHLLKFSRNGQYLANFDFGWDVTPAVYRHDGTYSIITKDNHYGTDANGADLGPYYITRLDKDLKPEWKFLSTNTQNCSHQPDGSIKCVSDHPHGFEWCINAPAVDAEGSVYANGEDGDLYVIDRNGQLKASFFLDMAQAAAYTPLALDYRGHIFALNGGHVSVVGQ